ncbi:MAG: hypothetical protein KA306_04405 [Enterococcus sp.]|nr:hypothetical protein [Enterococcus sp.]
MKKMLTYVPAFLFSLLLLITKPSGIIVAGFVFLVVLMVIAKYSRSQQEKETLVFDERVQRNTTTWRLRTMYGFNSLLLLILLLNEQGILTVDISINGIMIYLMIYLTFTLLIPFYVIPTIIDYF